MTDKAKRLSEKSVAIMTLIAEGHSYRQIVDGHSEITYMDIFRAASEALEVCGSISKKDQSYQERMGAIRMKWPRAYDPWTEEEEERLKSMRASGMKSRDIANELQRKPSAVRSRMDKLGLLEDI